MALVAVIDSGVNPTHPHLANGEIIFGPVINADGDSRWPKKHSDRLGHGTAVAAAILDLAPTAGIFSVQVFQERPECRFENVLTAIRAAFEADADVINLSLGTSDLAHVEALEGIIRDSLERGIRLVAPASFAGLPSYPGMLDGAEGVLPDPNVARGAPYRRSVSGRSFWQSSPYPREIPGVPVAANLKGVSMATANVSGYLARSVE